VAPVTLCQRGRKGSGGKEEKKWQERRDLKGGARVKVSQNMGELLWHPSDERPAAGKKGSGGGKKGTMGV